MTAEVSAGNSVTKGTSQALSVCRLTTIVVASVATLALPVDVVHAGCFESEPSHKLAILPVETSFEIPVDSLIWVMANPGTIPEIWFPGGNDQPTEGGRVETFCMDVSQEEAARLDEPEKVGGGTCELSGGASPVSLPPVLMFLLILALAYGLLRSAPILRRRVP